MLGLASALSNSISVILSGWAQPSAILYPIICVCIEFDVVASIDSVSGIFTLELAFSNSISVFFFVVMVIVFESCLGSCNYISIKCFRHAIGYPAFARVK